MNRKILSLFMTLVILAGMVIAIPAYAEQPVSDQLLLNLGIIQESKDTEKTVSREEFSGVLMRLMKLPALAIAENPFKVEEIQKNGADAMYTVYMSGYMKLMENGQFGANYPITYDEAIYSLIKALGYDVLKSDKLSQAVSIGLLKGVKYENEVPMSYSELTILLKNALEINLMQQSIFGGEIKYETIKNVNLLSENFDVYKSTGVVTGTSTAKLGIGNEFVGEDQLLIESELYNFTGITNIWIGLSVEIYYHQSKLDDEKDIIYISEKSNKTLALTFEEILESSTKSSFEYDRGEKIQKATISSSADLIYNNKTIDFTVDFPLYIKDSKIQLIDNDNDGSFDVVIVTSYVNYYVSSVLGDDMILRDKYGQKVLKLEDANEVHIYKEGQEVDFSKIKPGNAISVVADRESVDSNGYKIIDVDKAKIYHIYINEQKISSLKYEKTVDGLNIDNKEYEYAHSLNRAIHNHDASNIDLGLNVTLFLDICGNIMAYEANETQGIGYGYLMDCDLVKVPFGNEYKVKLLNQNGLVEVLSVSKKVELDGEKVDSELALGGRLFKDGVVEKNLIRFETNSNNEIILLDTIFLNTMNETKENSLIKSYNGSNTLLYYNKDLSKIFGGKVILGDAPKIFVVPDPTDINAQDDDYYVTDESYFGSTGDFYVDSYNAKIRVSNLIVAYEKGNFATTLPVTVVTGLGRGLNSNGESVYVINGFLDGKETKLFLKNDTVKVYKGNTKNPLPNFDFSAINAEDIKGNVLRCITDKQGRVTAIQILFEAKNPGTYGASGTNFDSSYRTVYSRAVDMNEQILEISISNDLSNENDTEAFVLSGVPIYELKDNKIYKINIENINTYKPDEISSLASNVFLFSTRSKAKIALIIN